MTPTRGVTYGVMRRLAEGLQIHLLPQAETPADDRQAWDEHMQRLSAFGVKLDGAAMFALGLLLWPTDLLVFERSSPLMAAMITWRVVIIVLGGLAVACTHYLRSFARHPLLVANACLTVGLAACGWLTAQFGGLDGPLFHGVYTAPLLSVLVVAPLWSQAATAANIVISFLVAFFLTSPESLHHAYIGVPLVWLVAASITAVLVGQVVVTLLRVNFVQRRALERRAGELEALDRAKNDFFANVNHELRTPLTNIVGALRTLARTTDDGQRRVALDVGVRSSERLMAMLGDLLTLSRLDGGRATTVKRVTDVGALTRAVATEFQGDVAERLRVDVPSAESVLARVDAQQLRTVLYNLLSNAFKFSHPESPLVEVGLAATDDELTLRVRDYGIGIAPNQMERIFERFYQVEGGLFKRYAGVGIGLALVKEIVDRHGGSIQVQSALGEGSTFTVRLPRGEVSALVQPYGAGGLPPGAAPAASTLAGARQPPDEALQDSVEASPEGPGNEDAPLVLVAEDDPDLRAYLVNLLRQRYRVLAAVDGVQALEVARQRSPHLVLTDVMMPRLSGTELLRELRRDRALAHVPVVLLTAVVGTRARVMSLREGANDYVAKPFDDEELLARLDSQLRLSRLTRDLDAQVDAQIGEIRRLADNLVAIQEGERTRIAREIHDELGQVLTALRLSIDHAHRLAERCTGEGLRLDSALQDADRILERVHEAVADVLNQLRPGSLEALGLSAAIQAMGQEVARRKDVRWQFRSELADDALPDEHAVALFRIVQEALTNVARHAQASSVSVSFDVDDEHLRLCITDDGLGFEPSLAAPGGHFGLLGIRERARLLHGTVTVDSQPGAGTRLEVTIPFPP